MRFGERLDLIGSRGNPLMLRPGEPAGPGPLTVSGHPFALVPRAAGANNPALRKAPGLRPGAFTGARLFRAPDSIDATRSFPGLGCVGCFGGLGALGATASGAGPVEQLQAALNMALAQLPPVALSDGSSRLAVDGIIGPVTISAMDYVAQGLGALYFYQPSVNAFLSSENVTTALAAAPAFIDDIQAALGPVPPVMATPTGTAASPPPAAITQAPPAASPAPAPASAKTGIAKVAGIGLAAVGIALVAAEASKHGKR
jgi:hypothetical protein